MVMDSLAYRTARSQVHAFKSEGDEIMARHYEANDCVDCESYLQLGIDAYNWLRRARMRIQEATSQGKAEPSSEADDAIEVLYRLWLQPVEIANKRIEIQINNGFEVSNLNEFRECERAVRIIVKDFERMIEIGQRVPSFDELSGVAADPSEWLGQPGWVR